MEYTIILLITVISLLYLLCKSNMEKRKLADYLIPHERIRTLLHLSQFKNNKIWIELCASHQTFDKSQVVNGIVDAVIQPSEEETYHPLLGGSFYLINNNHRSEKYNIYDVRAVSFKPLKMISPSAWKGASIVDEVDEDTLNFIQHFTSNYGNSYYEKLSQIYKTLNI